MFIFYYLLSLGIKKVHLLNELLYNIIKRKEDINEDVKKMLRKISINKTKKSKSTRFFEKNKKEVEKRRS